ncbi:fungal-specific transcription factor domain-containing protein [Bisporella sp. PMI_857]|nr:fungal-specific transcription factor domain-containing protein [Bisporella sp. PMI_857]
MNRDTRLPTRVSKACNRCKKQKQRVSDIFYSTRAAFDAAQCDLERPCRHCVHAGTECITDNLPPPKRPRLRKIVLDEAPTPEQSTNPPFGHSQTFEQSHLPRFRMHDSASNLFRQASPVNQPGPSWTSPNTSSVSGDHCTTPQLRRANSNFLEFEADSALAITRKIFRTQSSPGFKERVTSAIPGGGRQSTNGINSASSAPAPLIPVSQIIGMQLPNYEVCNKLLETYFSTVHWFSLVVYEPKFRSRYNAIIGSGLAGRNDHGYLLLLLMVLVMGCWYTPKNSTKDLGLSSQDMDAFRKDLLKTVQRDFMDLMDEDCLEFVQLCALLGSFYLYHGKPRSSFSILGAATKTAQAMDLHRDSEAKWPFDDREERKRVWWTIYTWDRFATITYGRPLGINEKDCNVQMPAEIIENVHFDTRFQPTQTSLSSYQFQLNLVYRIASPLLEDIYGMRSAYDMELSSKLPSIVATANQALLSWQNDLPHHLSIDRLNDLTTNSPAEEKMHKLQALSLQLTYDNIMIVLHRPMLAGQGHAGHSETLGAISPASHSPEDFREVSFNRCLRSALRISNIQQRKPNLFTLARATHLVSFLGMNLFTASVVLFICALSDTLSDTAQEAKRGLRRTLQMQKSLSNYASLSMQCATILEDLVQLILKKEMEEMLQENAAGEEGMSPEHEELQSRRLQGEAEALHVEHHDSYPISVAEDSMQPAGSQFKQSLRTLQQVFHDNSMLRYQSGRESDPTTRQCYQEYMPADTGNNPVGFGSTDLGFNGLSYTRVEDLGQFWLWNMDEFNY